MIEFMEFFVEKNPSKLESISDYFFKHKIICLTDLKTSDKFLFPSLGNDEIKWGRETREKNCYGKS